MDFSYHSEQRHGTVRDGKRNERVNIVSIKNGKGEKVVRIGDKVTRKRLTKSEIEKIKRMEFIPGLFADCLAERKKRTRKNRLMR